LWRSLAVAGAVAALALGITLRNIPPPAPQPSTIAVMSDEKSQAAMVISWMPWSAQREPRIRVRIVTPHATMPDNTSWELWMVPGGDATPVSLGLVSLEPTQELPVRRELTASLGKAWGVALSVEPKGGSPTGKPTGPVIMKGQCVKM
jgi:anti-sigma-K factor RskA